MSVPKNPVEQYAALPYRLSEAGLEIMLVTSRETGRWIIPKGWPMAGKKAYQAAAREALEEVGVKGIIGKTPLATYDAWKRLPDHFVHVAVTVFALQVRVELKSWKEDRQRRRAWFPKLLAVDLVEEPGLKTIINQFHPESPDAQGMA